MILNAVTAIVLASVAHAADLAELSDRAERYPQDPSLALSCASAAFEAGEHEAAASWYARALELNPEHYEARLGLAWARWQLGEDTRADFEALVAERPGDPRAAEGLEASRWGRDGRQLAVAGTGSLYPGDAGRLHGEGVAAGLSAWHNSLVGGASYRGTRFVGAAEPEQGSQPGQPPGMGGGSSASVQHEAWAWAGMSRAGWGSSLHLAGVLDGSDDGSSALVLGAVGRLGSAAGAHLTGELSSSLYDDLSVHRLGLGWAQPLGPLTIAPVASLQLADDTPYVSGGLELAHDGPQFDLRVGGKLGREQRPVLLGSALIYNLPGTITGGGWAVASFDPGGAWIPSLSTELYRVELEPSDLPSDDAWVLTTQLALTRSF